MPTTLPDGPVRTHANRRRDDLGDIRTQPHGLRIDAKNVGSPRDSRSFRSMVREAMRLTDLSQKAFALNAGQPESVISEALNGTRHLASEWVWAPGQPSTFIEKLIDLIEADRGLTDENAEQRYADLVGQLVSALMKLRFARPRRAELA